jgi:hypothetical protein
MEVENCIVTLYKNSMTQKYYLVEAWPKLKGLAMPPTRRDFPKKKQKHADTGPKLLSAIKKPCHDPPSVGTAHAGAVSRDENGSDTDGYH